MSQKTKVFASGTRVGILGGGQLARMLGQAALHLGLHPVVLAESRDSPAAQVCPEVILGGFESRSALRKLFSGVRAVVFENEFIDEKQIRSAARGLPCVFRPGLSTMSQLKDKIRQKQILTRLNIPTAPYEVLNPRAPVDAWVHRQLKDGNGSCVFKWGRLGYDGKGVLIVDDSPTSARAVEFCQRALGRGLPVFAEERVPFKREMAVIGCRSVTGEIKIYPLVISRQLHGICSQVIGPASAFGASSGQEAQAQKHARSLAEALSLVGCFALEFFETPSGKLWVNEIAPRVHNSGHYSQDAAATSQFENHWRAVLGLPLGATGTDAGFSMLNLLGPEGVSLSNEKAVLPKPASNIHLHWYGKEKIVPWRKLGHLNGSVERPFQMKRLLKDLDACRQAWVLELRARQRRKNDGS